MKPALFDHLTLPVIAAPMFLVSGPELVLACCRAGIVGSFPSANCRTPEEMEEWLCAIDAARPAPYAVNIILREKHHHDFEERMAALERHRVPIIITSVGDPSEMVPRVHAWGGIVLHDVVSLRHARKAAGAGVDGLILVCAGAGGHAGVQSPFALLPQVREFFDKTIVLAGAISDGRAVRAARVLGADLCYLGTRFVASAEARSSQEYRDMILAASADDIVYTNAISSVNASYLRASLVQAGLDPDNLPKPRGLWQPDLPEHIKAWRDVWSSGQGCGTIHDVPPVAELVRRLRAEYQAAAQLDD